MMKLKWQLRLRLWLWQQRRPLLLTGASLLAAILLLSLNSQLVPAAFVFPLLTLMQLGIAGLLVLLVLILTD